MWKQSFTPLSWKMVKTIMRTLTNLKTSRFAEVRTHAAIVNAPCVSKSRYIVTYVCKTFAYGTACHTKAMCEAVEIFRWPVREIERRTNCRGRNIILYIVHDTSKERKSQEWMESGSALLIGTLLRKRTCWANWLHCHECNMVHHNTVLFLCKDCAGGVCAHSATCAALLVEQNKREPRRTFYLLWGLRL